MRVIQRPLQILAFTLLLFSEASNAATSASVSYSGYCGGGFPFSSYVTTTITCSITGNNLSCSRTAGCYISAASASATHQNTLTNVWFTSLPASSLRQVCANDTAGTTGLCWDLYEDSGSISLSTDWDNDGVTSYYDNCRANPNPTQANFDGDSLGDDCDSDDDNDGVSDYSDAFDFDPTETVDTDSDGIGNNADTDDDNDGVLDVSDNCPLNANAGQIDFDGDAQGDACDSDDDNDGVSDTYDKFPLNAAASSDNDLDGFPGSWNAACNLACQESSNLVLDNCPTISNTGQANYDNDNKGDACDDDYTLVAVAIGNYHTCTLTTAGAVKCWGSNHYGQLGDGTTTDRTTPVDVLGLSSGISAIAAGGYNTCALTAAGAVKCWGYNSKGQLGDGTTTSRSTPVDVSGLASGVSAIAAGVGHTCALTTAGAVKCWGFNLIGQLGDGTTTDRSTPVDVSGLASGASAISAGGGHTCALTTAGAVKCWGSNGDSQLGDGTKTNRSTPINVSGLASDVSAISAGGSHTCALIPAGGMKCWGENGYGQLGDGTKTNRSTPVDVSGLASGISAISAGYSYTCALTTTGAVKCWGSNYYGELGDGTITGRLTPVDVPGLASGVSAIVAGQYHTCALVPAGGMKCWGYNADGQLGDGTQSSRNTPTLVVGMIVDIDADNIPDPYDNCPANANGDQLDNDGDGHGDVCDLYLNDPADWQDADSDGIGDNSDDCPSISNIDQLNNDGDAQGDACDTDDDNDTMPDSWENSYNLDPFTNDALADADNDGINNISEYRNGSNPTVVNLPARKQDLDTDADSDLVFHDGSGVISTWILENAAVQNINTNIGSITPHTLNAICDVDHDLDTDLVFQNTATGGVILWVMQNGIKQSETWLGSLSGYTLSACGDTNKDGNSDLVFADTNGNFTVMTLNSNHTVLATTWLGQFSGWSFAALSDVDADGDKDIIMQTAGGDIGLITLEDGNKQSASWLGQWNGGWSVVGSGDADNDNDDDLFISTAAGDIGIVKLQAGANVGSDWFGNWPNTSVKAIGDINNDGDSDVIFQSTAYDLNVVDVQNAQKSSARWLGQLSGYDIKGTEDVDGDGDDDLVLQDGTGNVAVVVMEAGDKQSLPWLGSSSGSVKVFP